MRQSDEALALAAKLASGKFSVMEGYYATWLLENEWGELVHSINLKERIIALCLYAAILKDEGR